MVGKANRILDTIYHNPHTKHLTPISSHIHSMWGNRQARVVLEDRMKNSLQLTALRLNPRRLRGVQALT